MALGSQIEKRLAQFRSTVENCVSSPAKSPLADRLLAVDIDYSLISSRKLREEHLVMTWMTVFGLERKIYINVRTLLIIKAYIMAGFYLCLFGSRSPSIQDRMGEILRKIDLTPGEVWDFVPKKKEKIAQLLERIRTLPQLGTLVVISGREDSDGCPLGDAFSTRSSEREGRSNAEIFCRSIRAALREKGRILHTIPLEIDDCYLYLPVKEPAVTLALPISSFSEPSVEGKTFSPVPFPSIIVVKLGIAHHLDRIGTRYRATIGNAYTDGKVVTRMVTLASEEKEAPIPACPYLTTAVTSGIKAEAGILVAFELDHSNEEPKFLSAEFICDSVLIPL